MYEDFNENIYQPLGYRVTGDRFSYLDTIRDLLYLNKDNYMITKDLPLLSYSDFYKMIEGEFAELQNYSVDFKQNKEVITKLITEIL